VGVRQTVRAARSIRRALAVGAVREPKLYAYDKASGRLLAQIDLPANASGGPMTYMAGGKQYVAFPIGGANITEELIALALP
jgi:glucose dehydrogenase